MAELVYAPVLGTGSRKGLEVRVLFWAQREKIVKEIIVEKNNSGCRIDKFLKEEVFFNDKITRGEIIRRIKTGNIKVNNKSVKPSYVLKENDVITMDSEQGVANDISSNKNIKLDIIFSDENIIVVNKPAGIQVHPDFHEKESTLVNALLAKFPEIKNVGEDVIRPGIVHRLDKDTSGVMVIARNQKTFEELKNKFKNREIEKKYLAIVCGNINDNGVIEKPIARASNYKKQIIAGKKTKTKIRPAVTEYKKIKNVGEYSLVEVTPKTGRMHQIRVHLNSIGYPVVGDKLYRQRGIERTEAERQLLHAEGIKFSLFGESFVFEAPIPEDFSRFLTKSR